MDSLELLRGTKITEKDARAKQELSDDDDEEETSSQNNNGETLAEDEETTEEHLLELMKALKSSLRDSSDAVIDGIDTEATTGGMSLLSLKNLLMADYLKNMLILVKNNLRPYIGKKDKKLDGGESFDKVVERLVGLRVILERIRPVESKLKALIDRLVRQASQENNFAISEAKALRARPEDMVVDGDEAEGGASGEDGEEGEPGGSDGEGGDEVSKKESKMKKYKAPQLSAAYYDPKWEDSASGANRRKTSGTTAEQRMMMREMLARAEGDEPDEITNEEEGMGFCTAAEKRRKQAEDRHRQRFEEENFIRLPVEKNKRRLPTVGTADKILLYGRDDIDDDDLRVFASNAGSEMPTVGYAGASNKKYKKMQRKQKRKQKGKSKAKRAKRARRK